MTVTIKDGTGNSYEAQVDEFHRLVTKAVVNTSVMDAAIKQNAYLFVCEHTLVGATFEEIMLFTNTGSANRVHIEQFLVAVTTATANTLVEVAFYFDTTRTSGGTVVTPVNTNRQSGKLSSVEVYDNSSDDLVLVTDTTKLGVRFFQPATSGIVPVNSGTVFGRANSISMRAKGAVGDRVVLTVQLFEIPIVL